MVDASGLGGCLDLLVGSVRLGKAQVLPHRLVEEVGLLRDDADEIGKGAEAQVADVDATDRDAAAADVVQTGREIAERGLPRAGLADERCCRACRDGERDVPDRPVVAVAKPHVIEDDVPGLPDGECVRLLLDVDRLVEVFEDPVEERQRRLHVEADAEKRPDRKEEPCLQRRKGDEHRDGDRGRSVGKRKRPAIR